MKRFSTTLKNEEIDSIAIGGFDGLHIAHQRLISHLGSTGAVVIIDKNSATLTPKRHRCKYIQNRSIFLSFDEIKKMNAKEFISYLKTEFINLKKIIVGYDFRFGKDAHADCGDLKLLFDGEVIVVSEVLFEDISVHSGVIRKLLKNGNILMANKLLGRNYEIQGRVIKGQGIGKKELFATINIEVDDFLIPKNGVYASFTKIGNSSYLSASFIGNRLSSDGKFSIETHILDKEIEVKEEKISIAFVDFIRDNRKFDNLSQLKKQIAKDLESIRTANF